MAYQTQPGSDFNQNTYLQYLAAGINPFSTTPDGGGIDNPFSGGARDAIAQAMMGQGIIGPDGPFNGPPIPVPIPLDPNMGAPDPQVSNPSFEERFPSPGEFDPAPSGAKGDRLDSPDFDPYTQMPSSQNLQSQMGLDQTNFNERFVDPSQIGLPQSQFGDRFGPDPRFTDPSLDIPPLPSYLPDQTDYSGGTPYYQSDFFSSNPYLPGGGGRHGGRGNRSQVE